MAIWMDLTHTLNNWQGGVVGITRFELETAQKMKRLQPGLRFCLFRKNTIEEIPDLELEWLFKADNVADAYLEKMGRAKRESAASAPAEKTPPKSVVEAPELKDMYPALKEAYGYSLSRKERLKQAMRLLVSGLHPAIRKILSFLAYLIFWPVLLLMHLRIKIKKLGIKAKTLSNGNEIVQQTDVSEIINHPFSPGDVLYSSGWIDSVKFHAFSIVKSQVHNLKISHFVYDMIPYNFRRLYPSFLAAGFIPHIDWISENCDLILYLGQTAQYDAIEYQKNNGLFSPPSAPVKIGTERFYGNESKGSSSVLKNLGVSENFILTVGTVDPRKNYETIYKAYVFLSEILRADKIPQLVIVGNTAYNTNNSDLVYTMKTDPRTCDNIILISPSDNELDLLYKKCSYFVLPSLYEGYCLTMSEALAYSNFCIVSDIPPLREVGADFVDYIDPLDPLAWAKRIAFYAENREELVRKTQRIEKNWKVISWEDCARQILDPLNALEQTQLSAKMPNIYYNFTTLWLHMLSSGGLSGITRVVIMLAKHMRRVFPHMKFYSLDHEGYHRIPDSVLQTLFGSGSSVEAAYEAAKNLTIHISQQNISFESQQNTNSGKQLLPEIKKAFWLFCSVLPEGLQGRFIRFGLKRKPSEDESMPPEEPVSGAEQAVRKAAAIGLPFEKDAVVFSPAFDHEWLFEFYQEKKKDIGFQVCQVLYDFSPVVTPQLHNDATVEFFPKFLDNVYQTSDVIFYGGKTSMEDGTQYVKDNNLPEHVSIPIKFGNDISPKRKDALSHMNSKESLKEALKGMGITEPYILTVGTIEARKNHETLYKAYLAMIEQGIEPPQLIIAGHVGWKIGDFLGILERDERVAGKILHFAPSDSQLDLLYHNCLFTVLASQYEGWSLTLPESYGYGKFCLVSDVAPLRETGGDLAEYIHPFDTEKWAERIAFYAENPDEVAKWENKIKSNWHSTTWQECAGHIAEELIRRFSKAEFSENMRKVGYL